MEMSYFFAYLKILVLILNKKQNKTKTQQKNSFNSKVNNLQIQKNKTHNLSVLSEFCDFSWCLIKKHYKLPD